MFYLPGWESATRERCAVRNARPESAGLQSQQRFNKQMQTWYRFGWAGAVFEDECSLMTSVSDHEPSQLTVSGAVQNTYFHLRWKRTEEEALTALRAFHEMYTKPCQAKNCPVCQAQSIAR